MKKSLFKVIEKFTSPILLYLPHSKLYSENFIITLANHCRARHARHIPVGEVNTMSVICLEIDARPSLYCTDVY